MPKFYFNIVGGGVTVPDDEGMELPDLPAARAEAMASARDLSLSADHDGLGKETRSIQILDCAGAKIEEVIVPGDGRGSR